MLIEKSMNLLFYKIKPFQMLLCLPRVTVSIVFGEMLSSDEEDVQDELVSSKKFKHRLSEVIKQ